MSPSPMENLPDNPFVVSLVLMFLAELGDKTQLIALAFATRYRMSAVMTGAIAGTLAVTAVSVGIGASIGQFLPEHWLKIGTGILLIVFAVVIARGSSEDVGTEEGSTVARFGPVVAVAVAFFLTEIGDKSMVATIGLAAQTRAWFMVWAGASGGMILANIIGITVGQVAGRRLPERTIRWVAGALFLVSGVVILIEGIRSI